LTLSMVYELEGNHFTCCKDVGQELHKERELLVCTLYPLFMHSFIHSSIEAALPTHFVYIVPSRIEWHHLISFVFVGSGNHHASV
jgi:hypothetical protein